MKCHNPYFSRWFSAIEPTAEYGVYEPLVTILILVDGFLQYRKNKSDSIAVYVTILILVDGFLQYRLIKITKYVDRRSQSLF